MSEIWKRRLRIGGYIVAGAVSAYAGLAVTALVGGTIFAVYFAYNVNVHQVVPPGKPEHFMPWFSGAMALILIAAFARYRPWRANGLTMAVCFGVLAGVLIYAALWTASLLLR